MQLMLEIMVGAGIVIALSLLEFWGSYPDLSAIWQKTADEELRYISRAEFQDGFQSRLMGTTFTYYYDFHPKATRLEVVIYRGPLRRRKTVLEANFKEDRVTWWKLEDDTHGREGASPAETRMLFETLARIQIIAHRKVSEAALAAYLEGR